MLASLLELSASFACVTLRCWVGFQQWGLNLAPLNRLLSVSPGKLFNIYVSQPPQEGDRAPQQPALTRTAEQVIPWELCTELKERRAVEPRYGGVWGTSAVISLAAFQVDLWPFVFDT